MNEIRSFLFISEDFSILSTEWKCGWFDTYHLNQHCFALELLWLLSPPSYFTRDTIVNAIYGLYKEKMKTWNQIVDAISLSIFYAWISLKGDVLQYNKKDISVHHTRIEF